MKISKNISTYNFTPGIAGRVKYIVVHYTANNGDTAHSNTNYFLVYRGASAHYFIDEKGIWQSVEDENIAWHCGTTDTYNHAVCRNNNSIGIELCSRNTKADKSGTYYFKEGVVDNAIELTKYLMAMYNVPTENVIRHYDVTGKTCPVPFINDVDLWNDFKNRLVEKEEEEVRYNTINEVPDYAEETIQALIDKGVFGDENKLDLSLDMIRVLVFNYRAGVYK